VRASARTAALAVGLLLAALAAHAQPVALRGVPLTDHRGQALAPAASQGRVVLLNFVFTGCSAICPVQVRELAELRQALPPAVRAATVFLSVSVDPANDTPATLAAFARRMGADQPGWHFATGEPASVHGLLERMQALNGARPADHRTSLYLFDARGDLMQRFAGVPVDRTRLAREITQLTSVLHKARP
jgi:cytochrome oxidase Cu insertion factor (SCO1/SenC/PrrC family)